MVYDPSSPPPSKRDPAKGASIDVKNSGLDFHIDRIELVRMTDQHGYDCHSKISPCGGPQSAWPHFVTNVVVQGKCPPKCSGEMSVSIVVSWR